MAGTQSQWLHVDEETLCNAAAPNNMARPEGLNKHKIIKVLRQTGVPKPAIMSRSRYKSSHVLRKALKKYVPFAVITMVVVKSCLVDNHCPTTSDLLRDLVAIPYAWPPPPHLRWQSEHHNAQIAEHCSKIKFSVYGK